MRSVTAVGQVLFLVFGDLAVLQAVNQNNDTQNIVELLVDNLFGSLVDRLFSHLRQAPPLDARMVETSLREQGHRFYPFLSRCHSNALERRAPNLFGKAERLATTRLLFRVSASATRSANLTTSSVAQLTHLEKLWDKEQRTVHEKFILERQTLTLDERVKRGLALRKLEIIDTDAAVGGRVLLWLQPADVDEIEEFRNGPGTPVRLWYDGPDSDKAICGIVSRFREGSIGIIVDEFPEALEDRGFNLDTDEPQSTFERGKKAIERFRSAEKGTPLMALREVLFGQSPPTFDINWTRPDTYMQTFDMQAIGQISSAEPGTPIQPFDSRINEPQWEAITHALSANHVALIHGPPGTGKTRTLVEVIRQAVAQGRHVLASAASNAAVDNLAERLIAAGLQVVRLGHPARVSPEMEAYTLDALVEGTVAYKNSRKWTIEANALRRKIVAKRARGDLSRDERKTLQLEIRNLFRDSRKQVQYAQDSVLGRAQVICSTVAGADTTILGDMEFDLVVLDEATQAPDPLALVACSRGKKVIMAGDPCQLPPTVIDLEAARAGLGITFFERLMAQRNQDALRMLTVQYRMHKAIMAFPSTNMYDGRLTAAPEVAKQRLHEIKGVAACPLRDAPFLFLDTAGKDWVEKREIDDVSTSNPLQAERTAAEVLRLVSRGLHPSDVAVITPYNAQVKLLKNILSQECSQGLEINSVDGFQGREKEAVVFDLVRSNDKRELGFVEDARRMNVALTRAKRFLLVIGDSATLGVSENITALLKHAEEEGAYISAWTDDAPLFEAS